MKSQERLQPVPQGLCCSDGPSIFSLSGANEPSNCTTCQGWDWGEVREALCSRMKFRHAKKLNNQDKYFNAPFLEI